MASSSIHSSSVCDIEQQHQQQLDAAEPPAAAVCIIQHQQPQAGQPLAAAVCESGRQNQQKSGVLQRAAKFMMFMVWEVTFSG
jgi:soluble lytic murein transglycosylase-like protein